MRQRRLSPCSRTPHGSSVSMLRERPVRSPESTQLRRSHGCSETSAGGSERLRRTLSKAWAGLLFRRLSRFSPRQTGSRNGAAEVLQDVGLVDHLALEEPQPPTRADL